MLPNVATQRKKCSRQRRTTFLLFYLRNLVVLEQYKLELTDKEELTKVLKEIHLFLMEDEKALQETINNQQKDAGTGGSLIRSEDWDILINAGFISSNDDERA